MTESTPYVTMLRSEYEKKHFKLAQFAKKIRELDEMPQALSKMTTEAWFAIFKRLPVSKLGKCCLVCTAWNAAIIK
jgi:hypothetical protein